MDEQFGPVILLGIGGTAVEVYQDTVIRMAPLTQRDVESMVNGLTARRLLEGYRGSDPVDRTALSDALIAFSRLVMELEECIESADRRPEPPHVLVPRLPGGGCTHPSCPLVFILPAFSET